MSTYVCGNCGEGKDLTKDGGMTVGVNTYCFQPDCMAASMRPIKSTIDNLVSADWCATDGTISISGTRFKEHSRASEGERWCFHCRKRREFIRVLMVPDGVSYYEPYPSIHCNVCGLVDSDLFPGRVREWSES